LGWPLLRGLRLSGLLTAIFVAAERPPAVLWVPLLLVLTVAVALIDLRSEQPKWYDWLRGRRSESK
jgi:hypothetical protein